MLLPVLKSVTDDIICNMVLTLICESWLDHIYAEKIKFSRWGAFQLLCDFAFVSVWIENCPFITDGIRKKLLKNEILRRCEGVGRLLLRCPGERLKMVDKKINNKSPAGLLKFHIKFSNKVFLFIKGKERMKWNTNKCRRRCTCPIRNNGLNWERQDENLCLIRYVVNPNENHNWIYDLVKEVYFYYSFYGNMACDIRIYKEAITDDFRLDYEGQICYYCLDFCVENS